MNDSNNEQGQIHAHLPLILVNAKGDLILSEPRSDIKQDISIRNHPYTTAYYRHDNGYATWLGINPATFETPVSYTSFSATGAGVFCDSDLTLIAQTRDIRAPSATISSGGFLGFSAGHMIDLTSVTARGETGMHLGALRGTIAPPPAFVHSGTDSGAVRIIPQTFPMDTWATDVRPTILSTTPLKQVPWPVPKALRQS